MSEPLSEPKPDQQPEQNPEQKSPEQEPAVERPSMLGMLQSVAAAAFGVQSEKKRQQDFQAGKPGDYIALGVIFVIAFIITLIVVVNIVLDSVAK